MVAQCLYVEAKTDFEILARHIVAMDQVDLDLLIQCGVLEFFLIGAIGQEALVDLY